jgi:hypothetical protein
MCESSTVDETTNNKKKETETTHFEPSGGEKQREGSFNLWNLPVALPRKRSWSH